MSRLTRRFYIVLLALPFLVAACAPGGDKPPKPGATVPAPPPAATATPPPPSEALRRTAESRYLKAMSPTLADLIKQQPWYAELNPARLEIIAQAQKCEKLAQPRGEVRSVAGMLQFASEQGWYQDGLEDRESLGLSGVFEAYGRSLEDDYATPLGPILASTLRLGMFEVVQLPESGQMVLMVSSDKPDLGKQALDLGIDALPKIEQFFGKFPYKFLHLEVTKDLPEVILGVSYNEFITLREDSVDAATVNHEITHSTLYGDFPLWFEEGFAHFIEYYLTDTLQAGQDEFAGELRQAKIDPRLDLRAWRGNGDREQILDRLRGFLFVKALYDVQGPATMSKMVRTLRTHTYSDQDLIRAIATFGTPDEQLKVEKLLCKQVVGTVRNYCGATKQ